MTLPIESTEQPMQPVLPTQVTHIDYNKYLKDYRDPGGAKVIPVPEEAFRKYSERVKEWLQGIYVSRKDYDVPVEVIYGMPNIATALRSAPSHIEKPEINRELIKKLVDLREDRAKIPIISFYISGVTYAMGRQLPGNMYYKDQFVDDSMKDARMVRKPVPFDLQYTAAIWTTAKSDMFFIHNQILSKFNPALAFNVEGQEIPVFIDSVIDTSTLEVSGGQMQLVRFDVVFHLEAWVKQSMASVRTVLKGKLAYSELVYDEDGGAISGSSFFVETVPKTP